MLEITGTFGYGTASLTFRQPRPSITDALRALNCATQEFDTHLINGADFYGPDYDNYKLLKTFLDINKDSFDRKLIYAIKSGFDPETFQPNNSREFLDAQVKAMLEYFPVGMPCRPHILFQPARVDAKVSIEDTMATIKRYLDQGWIDGIGLSEVGASTIEKAVAVAPVSAVEVEFSLFCTDILKNGIIDVCSKHGIPIIAYSPLGQGILTDLAVENGEGWLHLLPQEDFRRQFDKFTGDNFLANLKLSKELYQLAHNKFSVSLETLSLSWLIALSENPNYHGVAMPKIIPIPGGLTPEKIRHNFLKVIKLSAADLEEIDAIVAKHPVQGGRYNSEQQPLLNG